MVGWRTPSITSTGDGSVRSTSGSSRPRRLRFSGRGQRLNARLSAARIGAVTIGYLRYGADVELGEAIRQLNAILEPTT